ncbi:MAG TPA: SoxR reducing system RseC family protein [bacterium]|nr:SoxR reducing system RseC family protein [bacterium]
MPSEQGIVISTSSRKAVVRTVRNEACAGCGGQSMCSAMGGGKINFVEAVNKAGASKGDRVLLEISDAAFMTGSFLIFFVPIVGLVAGVFLGSHFGKIYGWDHNAAALIFGLGVFAVFMSAMVLVGNRTASKNPAYTPTIVSVLTRAKDMDSAAINIAGDSICHPS